MRKNKIIALVLLVLITLALPLLLIGLKNTLDNRSQASAADNLETEGGVLSSTAVSKQTDSSASGGSYILFGENQTITFGPHVPASTPLSQGTKFVSPTGSGTTCSLVSPCSIYTGANNAIGGDVVFMRGGVYNINDFINLNKNTTTNYITFESYPGENAILDGTNAPLIKDYIRLYGNYYKLRKFEVRNMPEQGIMVMGNHNIIDGIYAHHNKLSGINIYSPSSITDGSMGSFNTIQNVTSVDNSDAGITGGDFNDGGNADGIAISGGRDNLALNVLVARNSDDGFDSWRSANSRVAYSIATGNGLANGNGIGFKLGGIAPSGNTQVDHSIAYDNRTGNFDPNGGENVSMLNVTSYNSRDYGIYAYPTTTIKNSISVGSPKGNIVGQNGTTTGTQSNNSWQRSGTPAFISTDPNSPDFLKPTVGGGFEDIGAWAGINSDISNSPTASPTNTQVPNSPTPILGLKYPPNSTFTSITPASFSRPNYQSPAIEPNFNTKITRVTDPSGFGGSTTIRHAYSKVAAWNKDGSKLMIGKYILDGKNYTVIKNITSLTGEYRWSNTDPNKIYVIEGDGDFRVWDVNTVTNILIKTFSGFDEVRMGPWEGNLSSNDSMVVLSGKSGTDYTAIVFDIKNNKEISRKTFPGVWENGIDWASISPNGKYVVINHACSSPCVGPVKTYDLNLNYIVDIAPKGEHADMTTDVDGNDYMVYVLGQNGYLTKTRVDTGTKTTVLQTKIGGHISCRNLARPGWCYGTLIGTGYNQAFAFKLDGSQTIQRFANHRSTNANYEVQPKGVASTDGTKILWTSDWGYTDGSWFDYVAEMP